MRAALSLVKSKQETPSGTHFPAMFALSSEFNFSGHDFLPGEGAGILLLFTSATALEPLTVSLNVIKLKLVLRFDKVN